MCTSEAGGVNAGAVDVRTSCQLSGCANIDTDNSPPSLPVLSLRVLMQGSDQVLHALLMLPLCCLQVLRMVGL